MLSKTKLNTGKKKIWKKKRGFEVQMHNTQSRDYENTCQHVQTRYQYKCMRLGRLSCHLHHQDLTSFDMFLVFLAVEEIRVIRNLRRSAGKLD